MKKTILINVGNNPELSSQIESLLRTRKVRSSTSIEESNETSKYRFIITDRGSIADRCAENSTPCVYIASAEEIERFKNVKTVYCATDILNNGTELDRVLRRNRDVASELTFNIVHRLRQIEDILTDRKRDRVQRDALYEQCIEDGEELDDILERSTDRTFAVLEGESAHHEGSGRKVTNTRGKGVFVKRLTGVPAVPGSKGYSAMESATQRHIDASHFSRDDNFRCPRTYIPLHYGEHSLLFAEFSESPTLHQVLQVIGDIAAADEGGDNQTLERITRSITTGLVKQQIVALSYWIDHAPSIKKEKAQSPEDILAYYAHAISSLPEKMQSQVQLSDEENALWKSSAVDILCQIPYRRRVT